MVVYGSGHGDGIRGDDVLMADVIWYATRMYGFLQIQFVTRFSNVSFIFIRIACHTNAVEILNIIFYLSLGSLRFI